MNCYDDARKRVETMPALTAHAETLMYDWADSNSHWAWLATAPVAEIVDWAEMVESMEREFDSPELPLDTAEYYTIIDHQMMAERGH